MKLKKFNNFVNENTDFKKLNVDVINESLESKFDHLDESEHGKLRSVKVTFDNGDVINTNMAAGLSDQEIKDYYKIGRKFNLGAGDGPDVMTGVESVEILESEDLDEAVKIPARKHHLYKKLLKFLDKFPDNAQSWSQATDEIRDMARTAREYHTEYDLDMLESDPNAPQPLDFTKLKSPGAWNTQGKKYILDTLDKMGEQAVEQFMDYFKDWFN